MSLWFGLSELKQLWRILKASYIPCDCNARLELLQPYLLPNNHSWVPLPPVSRSVSVCKWASQSVRLRPMQHSVCTEELQDNLLMGSRGLGLSILFILIRQNCWLLFCTHTHYHPFSSSGTLSKPLHTISHSFCLKILHPISLHDKWLLWCPID